MSSPLRYPLTQGLCCSTRCLPSRRACDLGSQGAVLKVGPWPGQAGPVRSQEHQPCAPPTLFGLGDLRFWSYRPLLQSAPSPARQLQPVSRLAKWPRAFPAAGGHPREASRSPSPELGLPVWTCSHCLPLSHLLVFLTFCYTVHSDRRVAAGLGLVTTFTTCPSPPPQAPQSAEPGSLTQPTVALTAGGCWGRCCRRGGQWGHRGRQSRRR